MTRVKAQIELGETKLAGRLHEIEEIESMALKALSDAIEVCKSGNLTDMIEQLKSEADEIQECAASARNEITTISK
jgi:hypothetical protein